MGKRGSLAGLRNETTERDLSARLATVGPGGVSAAIRRGRPLARNAADGFMSVIAVEDWREICALGVVKMGCQNVKLFLSEP